MLAIAYFVQTLRDRLAATDRERGATAVEYGLMVAGIAMLIIAAVWAVGGQLDTLFDQVVVRLGGTATA